MTGSVVPPTANPISTEPPAQGGPKPDAEPQPETDWKAEARKWEARAKEYKPAAEQLAQIQEANKTAEQKQADHVATLTTERDQATVKSLRYEVCEDMDLSLKSAKFLTGSTKAEIEESARALKELLGSGTTGKPATGLPPSPNAGRETQKTSGAEAGLAKARERFGDLVK